MIGGGRGLAGAWPTGGGGDKIDSRVLVAFDVLTCVAVFLLTRV